MQTAREKPSSILILGAAKSGTTALFYAIQNALRKNGAARVDGLFEPATPKVIRDYLDGDDDVFLVKALLGVALRWRDGISDPFDRKIVIYRDPRDNVISRIVFMLVNLVKLGDQKNIQALMEMFQQKENDPESISVLAMLDRISEISGRGGLRESMRNNALLPAKVKREHGDQYFMMPYEDLITRNFDTLSCYLGVEVDPGYEVGGQHTYVIRTKGSGDWKNWFMEEDIAFFAHEAADDYRLLGFDPNDPANADKVIAPATCSEYVAKQFQRMEDKRQARKKIRREKKLAIEKSPA